MSEQEFNYADFIKRLAKPKVVEAYCMLFADYHSNSAHTNHCILKLMHRLAWDYKMSGLFYQASLFRTFQRILSDPALRTSAALREQARFATFILRKFFETVEKNNKVFMEILFWKNSKEVYEVQEGYGGVDKSNAAKYNWTEEEDEELKTLFAEVKDHFVPGKDVIDLISDKLAKTKTRRQIIRQLHHLGVIDNMKSYTKKVALTLQKEWREEELENLTTLFEKYRSSTDILSRLVEGLLMKKSKKNIADKLLELGLIKDRKELRKTGGKRKSRNTTVDDEDEPHQRERQWGSEDDGELLDTSDDSSDDDAAVNNGQSSATNLNKISVKKSAKIRATKKTKPTQNLDLGSLKSLFEKITSESLQSAVSWLKDALESVAEDRDDDDSWEAVPLVPIMEDHFNAMSNDDFIAVVRAIGVVPPANEQERYWRIPDTLSAGQLRARVEVINKAERGELEDAQNEPAVVCDSDDQDQEETPGNAAPITTKKNRRAFPVLDSEDEEPSLSENLENGSSNQRSAYPLLDSEDEEPLSSTRFSAGKNKNSENGNKGRSVTVLDSDDEDDEQPSQIQSKPEKTPSNPSKKQKRNVFPLGESEVDEQLSLPKSKRDKKGATGLKNRKRSTEVLDDDHVDDSSEIQSLKRSEKKLSSKKNTHRILRVLDSDEEEETTTPKLPEVGKERDTKRSRAFLDSDDDEPLLKTKLSGKETKTKRKTKKSRFPVFDSDEEQSASLKTTRQDGNEDGREMQMDVLASDSDDDLPLSSKLPASGNAIPQSHVGQSVNVDSESDVEEKAPAKRRKVGIIDSDED